MWIWESTISMASSLNALIRSALGQCARLIRFSHEDERRPLHDRRARADEGNVHVLHLARSGASRGLQHAFDDVPETVYAPGAQASAERIERQLAVELDASALDEVEPFALLAET